MSTYEPGTVAVAKVGGVETRVMKKAGRDFWSAASGGMVRRTDELADIRPLVVLDPDALGRSTGTAIADCLRNHDRKSCDLFDRLADEIEAQTKPPRIPEPGLWGVVEAAPSTDPEATRQEFVRYPNAARGGQWESKWYGGMDWDELIDPTLIREGVQS